MSYRASVVLARACLAASLVFCSVPSLSGNDTNKATIRVGQITIPTGESAGLSLSGQNLNYLRAEFSITPLRLSPGDGKGLEIVDSNFSRVSMALDNNAPIEFRSWINESTVVDQANFTNANLQVGRAYDFTLIVGATSATLWWRQPWGNQKIGTISHQMTPPFKINIAVQRSGAIFSDILVKER